VTFSAFSGLFILWRGSLVEADWLTLLLLRIACELGGVLLLSFSAADCVAFSVGFWHGVIIFQRSFFAT